MKIGDWRENISVNIVDTSQFWVLKCQRISFRVETGELVGCGRRKLCNPSAKQASEIDELIARTWVK